MDDFLVLSPSSSSSIVSFHNHQENTNHNQKLQILLQTQSHHPWAYAIFWSTNQDDNGHHLSLTWSDGHFLQNPYKQIQSNDTDWFYVLSLTRSFTFGDGSALAKALVSNSVVWLTGAFNLLSSNCDRAKEAHVHGLETLVYVPTANGVVEMGSYHVVHETESGLVCQAQSLFGAGYSSSSSSSTPPSVSLVEEVKKTEGGVISFHDMVGGTLPEEESMNVVEFGEGMVDQQTKKWGKIVR